MVLADEGRKRITDALNALSPERADPLRARLESAQHPIDPYESGQGGFVVDEYVLVPNSSVILLTKAAYLAESDNVWRYGYFAAADCPHRQRGPQGEPFWKSKRSWTGPRDPEIKQQ